jgi:hypothetical protein
LARCTGVALLISGMALLCTSPSAYGQLFTNLQSLVYDLHTGDPLQSSPADGPKAIGASDFDGDGKVDLAVANTDGSVTLFFGLGTGRFAAPQHLRTGVKSLRGIVCADLTGDGLPDIAVAAPYNGVIFVFRNLGSRAFAPPVQLPAWRGVRGLAAIHAQSPGPMDLIAAGPNNGLVQFRNLGDANFLQKSNIVELNFTFSDPNKFPKPYYAMATFQPVDSGREYLLATHAETNRVWMLTANTNGLLEIVTDFVNRGASHGLAVGALLRPISNGIPDMVSVERDLGTIEIRAGLPEAPFFESSVSQRLDVQGGPRAVEIVDLDKDGWNDLVVAQRDLDSIVIFANSNGVFRLAAERPVGTSPREMVARRFDQDDFPDLAVMNRRSFDISILLAYPGETGYRGINHLYLVDGNVAGLAVYDFNHDGRDDVIQLHRSSGDFSVRLANPDGTLQAPVFYTVGNVSVAQVFADVNNDGIRDQITANLGTPQVEKGSVSIRLGNGDGTFGAEIRKDLPEGVDGRLFALVPGDFDGDGNIDLAAGFLDSRIAFFRGHGDGTLEFTRAHVIGEQARAMVAGDFDKDGDLDLAVVGSNGSIWVAENRGDLLDAVTLITQTIPGPPGSSSPVRNAILTDENRDGDLDLIVGNGQGAWVYHGLPGLGFAYPPSAITTSTQPVSDILLADLDLDGKKECVVSCRDLDCLSVFTQKEDGTYAFVLSMDAPASRFLATGDLDGDGKPDLVGSGRILWTALSSHAPQSTPPLNLLGQRNRLTGLIINEFLADNTAFTVDSDGDRLVEWVELFNAGATSFSLNGWKLRCVAADKNGVVSTNDFTFPPVAFSPAGKYTMVYFSETKRTLYHTGFKFPADGGTLVLMNAAGHEVDRVEYPAQRENVAYGRYRDALHSFVFTAFPSPGKANIASGVVTPTLKFNGVDPLSLQPGQPIRFFAQANADFGIASVTMSYQRLDEPNSPVQKIALYDDGQHGDGGISDSIFTGDLVGSLPAGAEIQFYFEVTDLDDVVTQTPEDPEFGLPGVPGNVYQLAMADKRPALEISEVVPLNETGLHDALGNYPDWVEVRNTSSVAVHMDRIFLAHQLGENTRFYWTNGSTLQPGEHSVILFDNNPSLGPWHAPLRLSRTGDSVFLAGQTTNNSPFLIDWLQFGEMPSDTALARVGAGGDWRLLTPTPGICNVPQAGLVYLKSDEASTVVAFAFPTVRDASYVVEYTSSLNGSATFWSAVETCIGDGLEKLVTEPLGATGFFRVRKQ